MQMILIGNDWNWIEVAFDAGDETVAEHLTSDLLTDAKYCLFLPESVEDFPERLAAVQQQLQDFPAAVVFFPRVGSSWLAQASTLPPRVFLRLPRLDQAAAISVPADRLIPLLPLSRSESPVQDALIRLFDSTTDCQLHVRDLDFPGSESEWSTPELSPGMSVRIPVETRRHLSEFDPGSCGRVVSPPDGTALLAGLWLIHDCLDESHSHSQSVQGAGRHAAGDYWHAIMHRREPDYGNSKYWYRRVGQHPVFDEMSEYVGERFSSIDDDSAAKWLRKLLIAGAWNPFAFVDFCEAADADSGGLLRPVARQIQWQEMLLLLRQTARDAYGN